MKKTLLSLALAAVAALGIQAQATPDNQLWWGYLTDGDERAYVGNNKTETYNQAIHIDGTNTLVVGKTIKSVRFFLRKTTSLRNVKLWLSKELPASASNADILCMNLDKSTLNGDDDDNTHRGTANDVELDEPYTVTEEGVYVGYTFEVSSVSNAVYKYPVVVSAAENVHQGGYWSKTSKTNTTWTDMSKTYGDLAMQVLLEGDFAENSLTPFDFGKLVAPVGESVSAGVTLFNGGTAPVSSISYTLTSDGNTSDEATVTLEQPYTRPGDSFTCSFLIPGTDELGLKDYTITITKVNGVDNQAAVNQAKGQVNTVSVMMKKHAVVEEFTGTGCGWCPRGIAGMMLMRQTFGDQFVGIALHQYNSDDAMYFNGYTLGFSGAPSCMINRDGNTNCDPYYGGNTTSDNICSLIAPLLEGEVENGVIASGEWSADGLSVKASATVATYIGMEADYSVELLLIGDSLSGTGSAWNQANYYAGQYSSGSLPEILSWFGSGGQYGQSTITGWAFDDVALASTRQGRENQLAALPAIEVNGSHAVSYTLELPTRPQLTSALDVAKHKGKIAVVALLIRPDGQIENADKFYLPAYDETAGISDNKAETQAADQWTDLQGRRVAQPAHGLYIHNGRKVVVK